MRSEYVLMCFVFLLLALSFFILKTIFLEHPNYNNTEKLVLTNLINVNYRIQWDRIVPTGQLPGLGFHNIIGRCTLLDEL